jgi:hypothetical protein
MLEAQGSGDLVMEYAPGLQLDEARVQYAGWLRAVSE